MKASGVPDSVIVAMVRASKDNGRNEVGPHYGRCCCLLGHIRLWACSFGAASSADLLVGRIVFSFFGLHLAKFATREMIPCPEVKDLNPEKWHPHLLRHACGTHMHDHDAPLQAAREHPHV